MQIVNNGWAPHHGLFSTIALQTLPSGNLT